MCGWWWGFGEYSWGFEPKLEVLALRGEGGVNPGEGLRRAGEGERERRVGEGE